MQEILFRTIKRLRFWFGFQLLLILLLNVIGHVREGNALQRIFGSRFGEALIGFVGTILGFPSGIYFLFAGQANASDAWFTGTLLVFLVPVIYYSSFFLCVAYIAKQGKHWRTVALCLLAFMILSFAGCSRVVEIPLIVT